MPDADRTFAVATLHYQLQNANGQNAAAPDALLNPAQGMFDEVRIELTKFVHEQLGTEHLSAEAPSFEEPDVGTVRATVKIVTDDPDALQASAVAPGLGRLDKIMSPLVPCIEEAGTGLNAAPVPARSEVELGHVALAAAGNAAPPAQRQGLTDKEKDTAKHWAIAVVILVVVVVAVVAVVSGTGA